MVEASTTQQATSANGGSTALNLAPIDQSNALGLFRQEELKTHVEVILAGYIAEAEKIA